MNIDGNSLRSSDGSDHASSGRPEEGDHSPRGLGVGSHARADERVVQSPAVCGRSCLRVVELQIRLPLSEEESTKVILFVSAIVLLFSFMFVPGKGLSTLLVWRGSFLRVCLVVVFLCLSCLPYIIIRKPNPYVYVEVKSH